ncbi:hypothetical protein KEH51_09580 [[Brevibacterium] frigoritolerans]|uniref:Methylmalonyl-CoA mutase domain-containing protein n=1 Tax=Peribacillus frigoritolerans TaxID=450367 RepID=A0A941FI34_9BACI|nr:hypothetical protein [Peribacillus frigoritolerans]
MIDGTERCKNITFPKPSFEEWKEAAEASLKGKSVEKLKTNTYEGIDLYPLYTEKAESTEKVAELPGFFPFTRGTSQRDIMTNLGLSFNL